MEPGAPRSLSCHTRVRASTGVSTCLPRSVHAVLGLAEGASPVEAASDAPVLAALELRLPARSPARRCLACPALGPRPHGGKRWSSLLSDWGALRTRKPAATQRRAPVNKGDDKTLNLFRTSGPRAFQRGEKALFCRRRSLRAPRLALFRLLCGLRKDP